MPGAMPNAMSREAAAPSAAAPPSRSFLRSMFARCVGEEQEQQAAAAEDAYSCGQQTATAGDSQEVQQLRTQVAQMQAQMAAQRAASAVAQPPLQDVAVTAGSANPFGFTKSELQKLSMGCDPADLKGEMQLVVARLKTHSLTAHQLLNLSSVEFEAAMSPAARSGAR